MKLSSTLSISPPPFYTTKLNKCPLITQNGDKYETIRPPADTWPSAHSCTQTSSRNKRHSLHTRLRHDMWGCLVNACALRTEYRICHTGLPSSAPRPKRSPQHFSLRSQQNLTFRWPCIVIILVMKSTRWLISQICLWNETLHVWTFPLSINSSFSLHTQQWYMSYRFADNLRAVSKPVWHIALLCVQWKTPDDGQRNCPKHVEFYSKNTFEKLVHLIGLL